MPVERTARTGPDGIWTVPDLPAGIYTALVPQPPGYGDGPDTRGSAGGTPSEPNTISRIPLAGGQQASGYTFGLTRASISGNVFVDLDGDGDRGPGEPGLGGVAVTVAGTDAAGAAVERSATTGPDGAYRVGDLLGGRYSITQTQPDSYGDGTDSPGSAGGTATGGDTIAGVEPAGGTAASGYDFGAARGARVRRDRRRGRHRAGRHARRPRRHRQHRHRPGTRDDHRSGRLVRAGRAPRRELRGVDRTARRLRRRSGHPRYCGRRGRRPSAPDTIIGIGLGAGASASGYRFTHDFGSAGGRVYVDRDRDGVRDKDEPGVDGAEVVLTGAVGTGDPVRRSTVTGDGGRYRVDGLLAGDYAVTDVETREYADVDRAGLALPAGSDATRLDVGLRAGALAGRVVDENGDGLAGATVTVTGTSVSGRHATDTAITGTDGSWSVPALPAGTYTVALRRPAGYGDGPDTPGTAGGGATAPNRISGIDLGAGQEADGYRFIATLGSVAGRVFVDVDEDDERDDGEPGVGGVTVSLTGADVTGTAVERSVVTGADGSYRIGGLRAGRYMLVETPPAGYDDGTARPGSAGGTTATPDVVSGIGLSAGEDAEGYDFLEHPEESAAVTPEPPAPTEPTGPVGGARSTGHR